MRKHAVEAIAAAVCSGAGDVARRSATAGAGDVRVSLFGVAAGLGYGVTATVVATAGAFASVDPGRLVVSWPSELAQRPAPRSS